MRKIQHPHIQIFEHEALRIGEERKGVVFSQHHWNQLMAFNARQYPPYFQVIHQGIRAQQFVGMIVLPGLVLEILPKTDTLEDVHWQSFLLDMLAACGKLPAGRHFSLLAQDEGTLSHFFIYSFLNEIELLYQKGLLKKYRKAYKNEHKFSGRILLHEHVKRNYIHKQRVYAEHQLFDTQHLLHEVIWAALRHTLNLSPNPELSQRIHQLLQLLPEQDVKTSLSKIDLLKLGREEKHYQAALDWAKFILLSFRPQLRLGELPATCFMIDMQQLFEEYVAVKLKQAAPLFGCSIESQASRKFWKQRSIRPDIRLTTASGENIILDTKWKILKHGQPDDADLKQIYIYNQFFKAERGLLLYPFQHSYTNYASSFHQPADTPHFCELYFVNLLDKHSQRLSDGWAEKLLEKILKRERIFV